jgi:hypothetical protein
MTVEIIPKNSYGIPHIIYDETITNIKKEDWEVIECITIFLFAFMFSIGCAGLTSHFWLI